MSDEKITINCGGCGCVFALFLLAATVIGSVVIFHHVVRWFA